MSENKLPSIISLYKESELSEVANENKLVVLLNQKPQDSWIRIHPFSKTKYIPIEIVEWLLTRIFIKWRVEVLDTKLMANAVLVTVRLHYKDPVTGEWEWQDGIGAQPLQTDKGAGATDFNKIKSDAVAKAAPSAESYAIKDAAEKLGKLFGKDLNRKDEMNYDAFLNKSSDIENRAKKVLGDE